MDALLAINVLTWTLSIIGYLVCCGIALAVIGGVKERKHRDE